MERASKLTTIAGPNGFVLTLWKADNTTCKPAVYLPLDREAVSGLIVSLQQWLGSTHAAPQISPFTASKIGHPTHVAALTAVALPRGGSGDRLEESDIVHSKDDGRACRWLSYPPAAIVKVNRAGFPGGSNVQVEWSHDEQDDEQMQP